MKPAAGRLRISSGRVRVVFYGTRAAAHCLGESPVLLRSLPRYPLRLMCIALALTCVATFSLKSSWLQSKRFSPDAHQWCSSGASSNRHYPVILLNGLQEFPWLDARSECGSVVSPARLRIRPSVLLGLLITPAFLLYPNWPAVLAHCGNCRSSSRTCCLDCSGTSQGPSRPVVSGSDSCCRRIKGLLCLPIITTSNERKFLGYDRYMPFRPRSSPG